MRLCPSRAPHTVSLVADLERAVQAQHRQRPHASGKAINDKLKPYGRIGQILLEAKQSGGDPFDAIETMMPWDAFAEPANRLGFFRDVPVLNAPALSPMLDSVDPRERLAWMPS